jgi:hypothetical protein
MEFLVIKMCILRTINRINTHEQIAHSHGVKSSSQYEGGVGDGVTMRVEQDVPCFKADAIARSINFG